MAPSLASYAYIYIYVCICIYKYDSKSLDVVQSLYFGSKLPSSLWCDASVNLIYINTYIYIYIYIYVYI